MCTTGYTIGPWSYSVSRARFGTFPRACPRAYTIMTALSDWAAKWPFTPNI